MRKGVAAAVVAAAFLLFLMPSSGAQAPPLPVPPPDPDGSEAPNQSGPFGFSFGFEGDGFQQVDYLQSVRFRYTVEDFSRDTSQQPGVNAVGSVSPNQHSVRLTASILENGTKGWQATLSNDFFSLRGGLSGAGTMTVAAGPGARPNYVTVHVDAVMYLPNGSTLHDEDEVRVQLRPYWAGYVFVKPGYVSTDAKQFKVYQVPIIVQNFATYLDSYELNVTMPPGYVASIPNRIVLPPESETEVMLTIQTPKIAPYVLQDIALLQVNAKSVNEPKAVYKASVIVNVRGAYISASWYPLVAFIAFAGLLVVNRRIDHATDKLERRGKPRRVEPTPRQAVLLAELKARDPQAYKERVRKLDEVYKARMAAYRARRKEEAARERAEAKEARAELKAEKERRKRALQLEAKIERERAKREKILLAEQRKRAAVLEGERAKLLKLRAKEEKRLAKLQAIDDKRAAKQAKIDAKEAEKRARAEAKEAKKRAKEERKSK